MSPADTLRRAVRMRSSEPDAFIESQTTVYGINIVVGWASSQPSNYSLLVRVRFAQFFLQPLVLLDSSLSRPNIGRMLEMH